MRMAIVKSLLLLSMIYFHCNSAQLVCWKCDPCPDPHDNTSSFVSAVTCTSLQTSCVKNTLRVLNQAAQIAKGCAQSCTTSSSGSFGQGAFVDCCNTNYCNFSSRNHLSSSFFILLCTSIFVTFYCT